MATVTLANGRVATLTPDNWSDLAAEQIAYKQANGGLNFQEQGATLNAFRQLAGLGNGFYTATKTGAAVETSSDAVLKMPLVRLADRVSGNPVDGSTSLWQDLGNSGVELAGNAKQVLKDAADKLPNPPGGLTIWLVVACIVGGGAAVYIATR